ncbi:NUDIX hydrolase [Nakamurella antarctica]|uniref:NUDIX hydrolase n=2 Tax=Nakamurella antarctica TaxID=1902245 RepID=A0A3G8ZRJ7_9ACTN|nr:NUDIX hydrolase [Nakamurella antarctica]
MPGGGSALREVVEHDRAVAVVAVDDEGHVVLVEQYRHPFRRRLWELPAGLLDIAGEGPQAAAARELAEEVGYAALEWRVLVDVAASPGFTDEAVRVFLATGLSIIGRQGEITDEEADLTVVKVPLAVAVAAVMSGDIVNGATVSGLLAAHLAMHDGLDLRPGDDPWVTGPAVPREHHEELGDAGGIIARSQGR